MAGTFLDAGADRRRRLHRCGAGSTTCGAALDRLVAETPAAIDRRRPRLWIDRVFAAKGSGTVVTGTLTDGTIAATIIVVVEPGARPARVRAHPDPRRRRSKRSRPGNRVALNLNGVAHDDLRPWRLCRHTRAVAADRPLRRIARRARLARPRGVTAGRLSRLRRLTRGAGASSASSGTEALTPGASGSARLFLPVALPLLPGDRYILRESGRDETVGGGVGARHRPREQGLASGAGRHGRAGRSPSAAGSTSTSSNCSRASPSQPSVGHWVTTPAELESTRSRIADARRGSRVSTASTWRPSTDHERAVAATLDGVTIDGGRARPAGAGDPYAEHPLASAIRAGGFVAGDAARRRPGDDPGAHAPRHPRRARPACCSTATAIDAAARLAAELLAESPSGFTVAQFRERTGIEPQVRAPAARRARRTRRHPPSRRPPHRRPAPPDVTKRHSGVGDLGRRSR